MKYVERIVLLLLFLFFDGDFNYQKANDFSLIVGLSENYSLKELLSWFLLYSYMYTGLILSCFRIINQTFTSYSLVRYKHRKQVMNDYLQRVFIHLILNISTIVLVIAIRKTVTPNLIITGEYLSQFIVIVTIGLFSTLILFVSRNLYFTLLLVNAYILGAVVFSNVFSTIPIVGGVLKFPFYLTRVGRESFSFFYWAILLISIFIVAHYVAAKKINYL
ncbi:hypothetical protein [Enterococcus plantarum]|uniref:hypothetical protein n=1 Tax=Enterococcus TaxID=1350 RepID=UPI001A8C40CD|nr:hypothetical protein [Enterococcus plantarum]MBO0468852.1 hypothetical protein [Enterococcus plantarum]